VLANEVSVAAPSGLAATITASVTAGAGASGALALMSMSKISVGILIAGMAATGAAIYEHRQLVQTESVLANVTGEYEAQAKQAAEAKSLLAKTEAALPAAQRDLRLEAEKNGSGASQSSSSGLSNGDFDFEQFLRGLAKDPAFAPLWHRHQLRQINRRFGELFLTLKLPADQLAKLRQLLIDRDEAAYDARDEAKKDGLGATATARAVTQAMGEVNSDIKTLIGADAYDQIQSEPIISGLKRTVQQQAGADLAAAGVPLSDDQLFALANIYFDVEVPGKNHSFGTLPMAAPPDTTTGLTPKNATILSQATRFLTAAQIPVLRQSLTEASEEEGYLIKSAAQGGPVFKIYGSPHP
jgi:hypothetical protein